MINLDKPCKIGVIDSGKGGQLVSKRIKEKFLGIEIFQYIPKTFISYSTITQEQLFINCKIHLDYLHSKEVDIIVVGCMTLSVNCLEFIKSYTSVPVFDMYTNLPSLNKEWTILATENSIRSGKFRMCVQMPCAGLSGFIEQHDFNWESSSVFEDLFFEQYLERSLNLYINSMTEPLTNKIIFGCTHYPLIKTELKKILQYNEVLDPIDNLLEVLYL